MKLCWKRLMCMGEELIGAAVLGQLFDRLGWTACVGGIAAALLLATWLSLGLRLPDSRFLSKPKKVGISAPALHA